MAGQLAQPGVGPFAGAAPVPFAIVEDLIVDGSCRDKGIGTAILDWIAAEAQARNIRRLFLESGAHDEPGT